MRATIYNTTSEFIPPGGAMEPTGVMDAFGRVMVRKPTTDNSLSIYVNGPVPIAGNSPGVGSIPFVGGVPGDSGVLLGVDPAIPGVSDTYGTASGSWYFKQGNKGFKRVDDKRLSDMVPAIIAMTASGSDPNNGTIDGGHTIVCQEFDYYYGGYVSKIKRVYRQGDMLKCEDVDPCCPVDYRCISNDQIRPAGLDGIMTCCLVGTTGLTRILQLTLSNPTGNATYLPALAYIVHDGGTLPTWSDGPQIRLWGLRSHTAVATIACDDYGYYGGGLTIDLQMSDMTGPGPVAIPCDLTNVPIPLGTFVLSATLPNDCGGTYTISGTVDIEISAYENGLGIEYKGVQAFGPNQLPPWDAGKAYQTYEEAARCCFDYLACTQADCVNPPFPFSGFKLSLRNKSGQAVCLPDELDLELAFSSGCSRWYRIVGSTGPGTYSECYSYPAGCLISQRVSVLVMIDLAASGMFKIRYDSSGCDGSIGAYGGPLYNQFGSQPLLAPDEPCLRFAQTPKEIYMGTVVPFFSVSSVEVWLTWA